MSGYYQKARHLLVSAHLLLLNRIQAKPNLYLFKSNHFIDSSFNLSFFLSSNISLKCLVALVETCSFRSQSESHVGLRSHKSGVLGLQPRRVFYKKHFIQDSRPSLSPCNALNKSSLNNLPRSYITDCISLGIKPKTITAIYSFPI